MNILYIDHYFGSPSMGMEYRPYYVAREWQKSGHRVLCVGANYSHLRSNQPEKIGRCEIDGLPFYILPTRKYQGNGLSRVVNMLDFMRGLFTTARKTILDFNPDVVISSSTYTWDNWAAGYYAKKCHAKYVYELHDIWPLSPMELGHMSKWHPFIMTLQWAEDYACKHAHKIISVLPKANLHLWERGMKPEKFAYVPNGILPEEWGKTNVPPPAFNLQPPSRPFTLGYVGGHALSNALGQLIDAAAQLPDVHFVLVGKGAEKANLMQKASRLANVEFRDPVKKTDIPKVLAEFDALYIGWTRSPLYRFGISPNKIYDYMMSGKPIVHAVDAANDPVNDAQCGISCEPESVDALVNAIKKMQGLPSEERQEMGRRGHDYIVANNLIPHLANKFIEAINNG